MAALSARFTIVTINSHVEAELRATLRAVEQSMSERTFQSLVVANGTTGGESSLSASRFESTLLRTEQPVAPGAILNCALERANREFIAFFPAGAIPEPYWYVATAAAFERAEVGAVVPRILELRGQRVRACGVGVQGGHFAYSHAGLDRDAIGVLRPTILDLAPLCGLVLRRDSVTAVGGFDADYPSSLFDFDWGLRARLKGLAIAYRPDFTLRYCGPLPLGIEADERSSAERFLARWKTLFAPNLSSETFFT